VTRDEWDFLALLVEEWWPGDFGDVTAGAWFSALAGFDHDPVLAALKACLARGSRWRPAVSEILAEIRRDPGRPTLAEALQSIFGPDGVLRPFTSRAREMRARMAACKRGCSDGWLIDDESNSATPCECRGRSAPATEDDMAARAAEMHPLIGAFVQRQGLDRLRSLDLDDPEWGPARRKLLADEWEELVDVAETRDVAALVAGRRGELGRFDPRNALSGPRQIERAAS
jgi:hypothetical protein